MNKQWTSNDIFTAISLNHIRRVTDLYLTDHVELNRAGAERRYWERVLQAKLANDESLLREAIPVYLTPDKDRGIEYTQEVIEMKSKIEANKQILKSFFILWSIVIRKASFFNEMKTLS